MYPFVLSRLVLLLSYPRNLGRTQGRKGFLLYFLLEVFSFWFYISFYEPFQINFYIWSKYVSIFFFFASGYLVFHLHLSKRLPWLRRTASAVLLDVGGPSACGPASGLRRVPLVRGLSCPQHRGAWPLELYGGSLLKK